jgi:hypothetical protein
MEAGYPRCGDGTLLCPPQLPGAPDPVAANGLIGMNSDDRHDFAEGQLALAIPLPQTPLQQPWRVERLKPLAKIVDIAEHGNERAHRDLRRVQADLFSTSHHTPVSVGLQDSPTYPEFRLILSTPDERAA